VSLGQLWTFLGVALPVLAALLVPMPSVDLTYQVRAGGDILAGNGIPDTDTWTYTVQGVPWLDQQWAAQAILAAVFQVGGWTGLAVLRAALVGLAFWFARSTLRASGCARRPATVLTLLSFIIASPALALRPQLFAIVLFAATMWILAKRREHPRRLWLIPVIALAWANLHGSFPLVVVLVALGWLDELLRARAASAATPGRATAPPASGRLLGSTGVVLIGAISAVVTLVTPFGIDTWRYVVSLAANPDVSGRVSEWRPPWPLDPAGFLFYLSVVAVLAVVWLRLRASRFRIRRETVVPFATLLIFGVLGAATGRGLAWWAIAAPVAAANLAHETGLTDQLPRVLRPLGALFRDSPARRSTRGNRLNSLVAAVLILAGVALLPIWRPAGPLGVPVGTLSHAPQGIAAELRTVLREGSLPAGSAVWNPQTWGSWLEWAVPDVFYTVDSRIELFPADLWDDVALVSAGSDEAGSILDTYKVRVVVLTAEERIEVEPVIQRAGFVLRYEDAEGSIWIRSGT
jgi:hypothetical protein